MQECVKLDELIYDIEQRALQEYKKYAKNRRYDSREEICKWLTCLINASEKQNLYSNVFLCKFSGFRIVINESQRKILWLYWISKNHKGRDPTELQLKNLRYWQERLNLQREGRYTDEPTGQRAYIRL